MRSVDRLSALLLLAICGYFWAVSGDFNRMGRLFPRTIIVILGVLALVLLIWSFLPRTRHLREKKAFAPVSTSYWEVGGAAGLFVAWAFFLHVVGFAVTSFIFFSVVGVLFEKREKPFTYYVVKVASIGVTIAVFYYFFAQLLRVPFPRGVLF
jgi:asparagine N-glycosylation enzyme membrane subunit Stt3